MQNDSVIFEERQIRRTYEEETEIWYFSVIDIIQILMSQQDYLVARKYWNKLKERLKKEGSEVINHCIQLKVQAADK